MCCADAPDTSGVNAAAKANAEIAKEALDFYRQAYAEQAPARQAAQDQSQRVSDAQVAAMDFATQQARDADTYNRATFRPIEQQIAADASAYDTPMRRMAAAQSAAADVDMSAAKVQAGNDRALARSGIAPGSARAMAVREDMAGDIVAARAGAMTGAVRNVEQQGYARRMDAAGLGRGVVSNQATQQQIASNAGSAGVNSAQAALAAAQSGNSTMQAGFGTAINANQSAGNLFGQAANMEMQADQANMRFLSDIGATAGSMYAKSDKNTKRGTGRMADTSAALAQVEATKVEDGWTYKDDPAQKPKTGPMAQNVRQTMGEEVAPNGKVIDMVSMNGRMLAAVQELAKRVKTLEKEAA